MPPVEQRYTPVPGFEHLSRDFERYNTGLGDSASGSNARSQSYHDPSSSPPAGPRLSRQSLSQPYSDYIPYENPYEPPQPQRGDSDYSYKDLPAVGASATAAGIGAGAAAGRSGAQSNMPMAMAPGGSYATHEGEGYQNLTSESYWPQQDQQKGYSAAPAPRSAKKKWWIIGGSVVAVLAVIGIVVGVVVSQVTKGKSSGSSSSSNDSTNGTTSSSTSSDPSNFEKNSNLHQSFWGIAYTPNNTQLPYCGATQDDVTADMQILSQLTTRLRLYGANCNTTALVLQAIQDTKVNVTIWPAVYVDSNETAYTNQVDAIKDALATYGTGNIEGIIVGNEYILDTAGSASNTSSAYTAAVKTIISKVSDVKTQMSSWNLDKTLPVGTSDAGSILSTTLSEGIDFYMANVHPYFGSVAIDDAATWTEDFYTDYDAAVAATASNNPDTYIAETGWPTQSDTTEDASDGAGSPQGDASVANLQTFLDTFVCDANTKGTKYFFFEAFDEPWKSIYGGVEPYWGLFDSNRNLKNLTIPTCS